MCRFANWTVDECWSEECVEAHTNVDITVDLVPVRDLLESCLSLVFAGVSVEEAEIPWPASGTAGPVV